ncbi:aminopyrimidine aminohydrolase mitochondrial isoform X2 [Tripterygium wilfordii]|uniref:Aminopyrimidine aminohydrolase mitochondrial isoform X2 n=1 Tax=Tripterygium wilfordii TaxID=458696 RepID=A0A7J7BYL5_TRIWF|nr:bifunctional TH2 protein, mitochondrial-like [Tripterygium wilfordii]KAF5726989.1 aminopyrimidine aminohydrolase mitochondrial isoform X2 [Tripterygium wilfordii]
MGGVMDEGGIGKQLWIKSRNDLVFAKYTPFFVCLASGHLDSRTLRHCISQEPYLLKAFAHAYKLAEECADDEEDKSSIRMLRKRVKDRLQIHDALVLEWGFKVPEESTCDQTTAKYTEFLLATALGKAEEGKILGSIATPFEKTKIAAYTLAAIAPCIRLYATISKEIQCLIDPDDGSQNYKKWVDNCCSQNLEVSVSHIEDVLDRLSVSLTGEELEVIQKLYHQAMKLQVEFFTAQPLVQKTIVPLSRVHGNAGCCLSIFCDFDLTCTTVDSSAILAELALITALKVDPDVSVAQLARMPSAELRRTWDFLSVQYAEEYDQCIESILLLGKVENFSNELLYQAFQQLTDFEKLANTRVVQSGVLKGLNLEDIKRAGHLLGLHDGCKGFFQKVVDNEDLKTDIHVLSYCWCGDLIRSAFASGDLSSLKVHSNELAFEESTSTGEIIKKVESPLEKLQVFKDVLKDRGNSEQHLTIYIGGSVGDLLCLLEADIGIVIGPSPSLMSLGRQFGVSFVPLFPGLVKKQRELVGSGSPNWKPLSGVLYTVSTWSEIHAFILGS